MTAWHDSLSRYTSHTWGTITQHALPPHEPPPNDIHRVTSRATLYYPVISRVRGPSRRVVPPPLPLSAFGSPPSNPPPLGGLRGLVIIIIIIVLFMVIFRNLEEIFLVIIIVRVRRTAGARCRTSQLPAICDVSGCAASYVHTLPWLLVLVGQTPWWNKTGNR